MKKKKWSADCRSNHRPLFLWNKQMNSPNPFFYSFAARHSHHFNQKQLPGFDQFVEILEESSKIPRHPSQKEQSPCFGAFILHADDMPRRKDNVWFMSNFAAFDLDKAGWTLADIKTTLGDMEFIAHTTTKSKPEHQRWRIIVRLDRHHQTNEYPAIWQFFNLAFNGDFDPATKDISRIFYMPFQYEDACNVFYHQIGYAFPVDEVVEVFGMEEEAPPSIPTGPQTLAEGVPAPLGEPIIPPWVADRFASEAKGGRFWRMLVRTACRYRYKGWSLDAHDLARAAMSIPNASRDSGGKRRSAVYEAQRAIEHANHHFMSNFREQASQASIDDHRWKGRFG